MDPDVTTYMIEAGKSMASVLMDAQVAKCMNGLGGSKTWDEFIREETPNKDLVVRYLEGEIDSVTAIYLAMTRASVIFDFCPNEQEVEDSRRDDWEREMRADAFGER